MGLSQSNPGNAHLLALHYFTAKEVAFVLQQSIQNGSSYAEHFGLLGSGTTSEFANCALLITGGVPALLAVYLNFLLRLKQDVKAAALKGTLREYLLDLVSRDLRTGPGQVGSLWSPFVNAPAQAATYPWVKPVVAEALMAFLAGTPLASTLTLHGKSSDGTRTLSISWPILLSQMGFYVAVDVLDQTFQVSFPLPQLYDLQSEALNLLQPEYVRSLVSANKGDRLELLCLLELLFRSLNTSTSSRVVRLSFGVGSHQIAQLSLPKSSPVMSSPIVEKRIKITPDSKVREAQISFVALYGLMETNKNRFHLVCIWKGSWHKAKSFKNHPRKCSWTWFCIAWNQTTMSTKWPRRVGLVTLLYL